MNDLLPAIDHAATMNDRWLVVALIALGLIGIVAILKWFISAWEKQSNRLTELTDRYIAAMEGMTKVVANNSAIIERMEKKL